MSNQEEKRCPLCAEEMDWTDQQLKPCRCGYEVCVWCWHHIMDMAEKEATEGRCPACRTPYDKDRIVGLEVNFQRVAANTLSRKLKQPKPKSRPNEGKKDLSNVRVIQRRMAYIIGLPLGLADEDLLQRKDYFGQYGKVTKVSLSRTAGGTVQQFVNDTCSVYITYSKEEEAVRCIQSVHGYVLDGRFLRASFGTAKYCHAWLRNMPCNNPACLYLHSIGAEEDSFGKDEIAAVHTRNRVQEIVGGTQYLHRRSGSMLPPPVDEQSNNRTTSAEEPVYSSGPKDVAYAADLPCSKDKDGPARSSKPMTTFVDIVGRSCNSGSDKDTNSVEEGWVSNLCSNMSSVCINRSNLIKAESSDLGSSKSSTPGQFVNGEPFREASKPHTKEQSGLFSDDQRTKDSIGSSQAASKVTKDYSYHALWHTESRSRNDCNAVNSYADEASIRINPVWNDGYNEKKFQSLAKSDRIYKCSKTFSNEEIVEHLRRLDDDILASDDENSAAVESSIISNILSMDFDGCDESVLPQTVAGLFEGKDGRHGSSWNCQNSDQSRFSFAKEQGYISQPNNLDSTFSNIGQELEKYSGFQNSGENKDYIYKSQYQVSRVQNLTPPGFSMPNKPPPGFPSSMRTEQVRSATSGNHLLKTSMPNNHYRSPSIGNLSNSSDDLIDPAIMVVGRGKSSTNGLNSSSFDMRSFDDEPKLWLLRQQHQSASATPHHHQQFPSSHDEYYSTLTSGYQSFNPSSFSQQQYTQPKYANGHIPNGDGRSEMGQRLGFDKLLPGYGDYMFQRPSSGDVYTRVFGM